MGKKIKTKVIYRERKPTFDKTKAREELKKLQEKRQQIHEEIEKQKAGKKGFSRFAASLGGLTRKASINKAIFQKRKSLNIQEKTQQIQSQVQFIKQRTELEQEKAKLRQAQQKGQKGAVDFGDIFGTKSQSSAIKESDIFK